MAYDLQLSHIGKVYANGTPAVIDFDLDVEKGEFIAFVGPSGCGKSTTLRMIAGFESITSGDLLIAGRRVNDLPPEMRPTSMIFQNYALFPHMTVRQNVMFGLEVKKLAVAEARRKVERILDKLGLTEVAEVRPTRLSGGQRQRIALARSLVIEPDILLLDEPLGALDANLRKSIQNELKLLQRELGITFVFVTHAQSEALALSDRIVVMNGGKVEQISPPRELYTRPQSIFVARFIGSNTLISGQVRQVGGAGTMIETPFGILQAEAPPHAIAHGTGASIVLPAEAIHVLPGRMPEAEIRAIYGANVIPCTINRLQLVGHILQIGMTLPNGEAVSLEGHADKYRDTLSADSPAFVAWHPADATLIAQ
ncbi:ABC transporter ATP-binding protein [Paracoccus sp. TOH]|uniref:ABC transporter ATP-binding protein n=1 Tax=Paracoccus sp. TOH TaxID=1263728 RepID=UPI0002175B36|nr:ABC transporter ATP-binding protein [Paracoccus sp. TOH]WJS85411.1 ABC transporter ATP-binding protein [Paracoccus sp. TOH]